MPPKKPAVKKQPTRRSARLQRTSGRGPLQRSNSSEDEPSGSHRYFACRKFVAPLTSQARRENMVRTMQMAVAMRDAPSQTTNKMPPKKPTVKKQPTRQSGHLERASGEGPSQRSPTPPPPESSSVPNLSVDEPSGSHRYFACRKFVAPLTSQARRHNMGRAMQIAVAMRDAHSLTTSASGTSGAASSSSGASTSPYYFPRASASVHANGYQATAHNNVGFFRKVKLMQDI